MNLKKNLIVVFAVLLCFSLSSAVEKTGLFSGIVSDNEGIALPGVSITLTGTPLQGSRTAVTNERGFFRFPLLPTGKDAYQATFILPGFKKVNLMEITIELGKTSYWDVTMETTTIEEEITVVALTPIIDLKSSTQQVIISKDLIETLANDRQYQMIMAIMPGAIPGNNPYMLGGSASDNIYLVDGMDSTDPLTKTWSTAMNFDTFEELQVITTGAPAEFGRGTGAVINIVTKSGSNSLHGLARLHVTKTDWNAEAQGARYYFSDSTKYLNETRPAVNLGGPIIRDRLWFFAAWEKRNKWKPSAVYQDFEDWQDLVPTEGKAYYRGYYLSGKLTFALSSSNSIMVQYMTDPIDFRNYAYRGYSNTPPGSDVTQEQGGWNMNSEWTSILGPNTYVAVRFNMKRNELNQVAGGSETPDSNYDGPVYRRGDVYYGAARTDYHSERYHNQYQLTLSHFAETGFGIHDLKLGVDFLDISNQSQNNSYPSGEYIRYHYDAVATPIYRYVFTAKTDPVKKSSAVWAFFIQDKWEVVPNLTLNIGLRAEMGKWKNHAGETIIDWGLGSMIAPRLGVAYNLKGNKISANFGRYYDLYSWWVVDNFQPDEFTRYYDLYYGAYYGFPTWNLVGTYLYAGGGSLTTTDKLTPSYMDEIGLGYEHILTPTISVGIDLLHRAWKNRIDDYDYDLDHVWHFSNETDFPDGWGKTYKKYDALILRFKKNLGDDKFQFLTSYTLSRLKGFDAADSDSQWGDSVYQDYNTLGFLPNDIRHMVKFNGNYFLPYGFNVGMNLYWFSGTPYTEYGYAYNSVGADYYRYYIEPRGSRRYPATWRIDLRMEKKFTFFNRVSITAYADIFNVLNNQIEIVRSNNIGDIILEGEAVGADYTIETASLNYGNFTQWFPPTSYFIGVKIEF